MSSVNEEKIDFTPYKKFECILNNKSETFENKVKALIDVWNIIADLDLKKFDIRYVIQIIDWAKLHALNIVLTGEWRSTKEHYRNSLLDNIEKAQNNLLNMNDAFSSRCQKLADVVKRPWEDPVLTHLLHTRDAEIGSEEIKFFCVETAYLVSVRLKKLCENHCEDLALNLVTNFLTCKKLSAIQNFSLNATETQMWFIFDIYIALLYKFQDKDKIVKNFEDLKLEEGFQLVKRFAKKRVKISKIWRNCHRIAIFGSRFFLSKTLMTYTEELKEFLENLLKTYIMLSNNEALLKEFVTSIRNLTNFADAAGLCVMCEIIHKEVGTKLRHFAIEMYIRALTTDMNELERLKHVKEEEKVVLTTSRLAVTFTNLADLLDDHVVVSRECVLTAFSLKPTKERLKKIEQLAKRSGFEVLDTGQDWKCKLHPPVLPSDDVAWMCSECGDWMCKPQLEAPAIKTNTALNEALLESVLGISEALCDDLAVCLSNPRYQILSWLLPWNDLYRLSVMYLNDPEKTKNFVTDLKFVDIDYSLFQHIKKEPVDEFTGIEKGYEQYLDLNFVSDEETSSVSEDSASQDRALSLGSDGCGEPYPSPHNQPKSDPNTLKSLRMFRPNLKRKSNVETGVLEKQFKTDNGYSNSSSLSDYLSSPQYNQASNRSPQPQTSKPIGTDNDQLTDSKNVLVATLVQLGGQVAINSASRRSQANSQQEEPTVPTQVQMKMTVQEQQNKSSLNGTKENTKRQSSEVKNLNSNRDRLLTTKQIFAKMMAMCNPQSQSEQSKETTNPTKQHPRINQDLPELTRPMPANNKEPTHSRAPALSQRRISSQVKARTKTVSNHFIKKEVCKAPQSEPFSLVVRPPLRTYIKKSRAACRTPQQGSIKCTKPVSTMEIAQIDTYSRAPAMEAVPVMMEQSTNKINTDNTQNPLLSINHQQVLEQQDIRNQQSLQDKASTVTKQPEMAQQSPTVTNICNAPPQNDLDCPQPTQATQIQQTHTPLVRDPAVPLKEHIICSSTAPKEQFRATVLSIKSSKAKTFPSINIPYSSGMKITKLVINPMEKIQYLPKECSQTQVTLPNTISTPKTTCLESEDDSRSSKSKENDHVKQKSNTDDSSELNINGRTEENVTPCQVNDTDIKSDDLDLRENVNPNKVATHLSNKAITENSETDSVLSSINKDLNLDEQENYSPPRWVITDNLKVYKNNKVQNNQELRSNGSANHFKLKDLKIVLQHLPQYTVKSKEKFSTKSKPVKCRRKILAPKEVQAQKLAPLMDSNNRNSISLCDKNKEDDSKLEINKKPKGLFKNIPGLNDYDMLRPSTSTHVVNVVQIPACRSTSQNTQTSTQITPHIQRIGQPRVVEQKPESSTESNILATTSCETSTTTTVATTVKPTTSQPSTLINILSQQIIRPGQNTVRRQTPFINILSQQIIRPGQQITTQKSAAANISVETTQQVLFAPVSWYIVVC